MLHKKKTMLDNELCSKASDLIGTQQYCSNVRSNYFLINKANARTYECQILQMHRLPRICIYS